MELAAGDALEELQQLRQRVVELERQVSERHQIEDALRESRELFQCFMGNSPVLTYMKDEEGRYVYVNHVIERYFKGAVEWRGKTDFDLWSADAARRLRENDQAVLTADRCLRMIETVPDGDGQRHWITFKFPFKTVRGRRYLAGMSVDITEKIRAETERDRLLAREQAARAEAESALKALRQSEARARCLVESDVIGVISLNAEKILESNDHFLRMLGYPRQQLLDGALRWRGMTPSEHARADDRAIAQILQRGSCEPFEKEFFTSEGNRVPVLMGGTLLPANRRNPGEWTCVAFVLDLTERKRLEERLLQGHKLESVGLLAGSIAHDFNNLLATIMGNASLSLDALSPGHPAYKTLEEVLRAARMGSDLTRQLLAFAGMTPLRMAPLNISDAVMEITSLVHATISKKIDLQLDIAPNVPAILADPGQIQQVLMNLIINGADAIGESTGTVLVTTGERDLDEEQVRQHYPDAGLEAGHYVYVEVNDSGCGMTEETRAHIFDPFFTTKRTGRGLGLAAALGIVRGHRGAMKVYSSPGKGSTFRLVFPAVGARAEPPHPPEQRGAPWGSGTVLVVDDEDGVRRMVKATLQRYGYEVLLAANGFEAVEIVRAMPDRIDLVLLDMMMPVMSGPEALSRVREIRPGLPILASSGYTERIAVERLENVAVAGFIQKPYTATQLAEHVKRALAR